MFIARVRSELLRENLSLNFFFLFGRNLVPPWDGKGSSTTPTWTVLSGSTKACASRGQLLCDITDMGVPVATELLDTISPQYVGDSKLFCASR